MTNFHNGRQLSIFRSPIADYIIANALSKHLTCCCPRFRTILLNLIFALAYMLLAQSGMLFGNHHGSATLWWPSGGFALALVLLTEKRYLPGIFLGALLSSHHFHDPLPVSLALATGNTLEILFGGWLLNKRLNFDLAISRLSDFLSLLIAAPFIALVGALVDPAALVIAGKIGIESWFNAAIHWWMADLLGLVLVTPLILIWRKTSLSWPPASYWLEIVLILGSTLLAGQIVFLGWFQDITGHYPQGFMMFLFLSVTAIRLGPHGVSLVVIMIAIQALMGATSGVGYFGDDIAKTRLTNFWLYMLVITVVGMVLAAYISEKKHDEEQIRTLAFYDPLTQLPNRRMLLDRMEQALADSQRSANHGALLFFDLDNFKILNDTLGHDKGDLLLQQVAQRLKACVREVDTVARLGGDEFVVMLRGLGQLTKDAASQAELICEKILTVLNQPYQLTDTDYHSTPSIGIALFADKNVSVDELMKQADIAMYQAKKSGHNTYRFFDPVMQAAIERRSQLENGLRKALHDQQFQLYFQVQVDENSAPQGAEALIRWQHPERGLIPPFEFIPLAEETGMIVPIGQWVLASACAQLNRWSKNPVTRHLQLAVNVSARQFRQPDFCDQVTQEVRQAGIDPSRLKLELTESLVLDNIDSTIEKMHTLKQLGIQFSIDDFGTGHSSLSNLKKLPLDQLKIDQSFVRDIATDPDDAIIVQTIIAMSNHLGIAVIAEGVETEQQKQFLIKHHCRQFQGYLFGKPMPIETFEAQLHTLEPPNA